MSDDRTLLRRWIEESERIVAFTGAGISTESGIPDFRSPGGIWSKMKPIQFQDYVSSAAARREAWRRKLEGMGMRGARPNRGHQALARLFERGKLHTVITQNVDGLHQASGVPGENVVELHGNATYAKCLSCDKRYELEPLLEQFRRTEEGPTCEDCGGYIKSATISFGQAMPIDEMTRAQASTEDCDLFIVLGSSLVVYPAAGFPTIAKRLGARLVIVNREPTEQDPIADLVIHDEIGPTMAAVTGLEDGED